MLSVLLAAHLDAAQPAGAPHAKPTLIAETTTLVPGETAWLGISFTIDDEWHIYWDGKGDTGQPVKAKFTAPPGFEVGEIVWPAPKRYVIADFALDYVYERKVTLLVPVKVPASAQPGQKVDFKAQVSWMECSEECRPGKADVAISLPVASAGESATKSPDAARFDETRKRIPRPVEETAKAVKSTWTADTVTLTVPEATGLYFYPHRTSISLADPMKEGLSKGSELKFGVVPGSGERLIGILEVVRPARPGTKTEDAPREFYQVDLPRTAHASPTR